MFKGKLCLSVSAILYGILPALTAAAYRGGANGITLTFLRSTISLPVLYAMICADKRNIKIKGERLRHIIILGIFGGAFPILFLYMSYYYISTSLATTLHFIYPLIIVICSAVLYRRRLPRVILAAVLFVTVGIFMFTDISRSSDTVGIVLALLSGFFYSFYVIYIEYSGLDNMDYIVLTFYVMLITSISMLIFGAISGNLYFSISPLSWSLSAIISLVVTLGAMPLFQLGVRYEGAAEAGILSSLEPVTSVILGVLLLGETINTGQIMGSAMILFGVLMAQRHNKEQLRLAE